MSFDYKQNRPRVGSALDWELIRMPICAYDTGGHDGWEDWRWEQEKQKKREAKSREFRERTSLSDAIRERDELREKARELEAREKRIGKDTTFVGGRL